jgi:hypothetical protein
MSLTQIDVIEIPVKFYDNLELMSGGSLAESLVWVPEIHVDSKYRNSYKLPELLTHEQKHYDILVKLLNEKRWYIQFLISLYNNFWDFFSCNYMNLKWSFHDRIKMRRK